MKCFFSWNIRVFFVCFVQVAHRILKQKLQIIDCNKYTNIEMNYYFNNRYLSCWLIRSPLVNLSLYNGLVAWLTVSTLLNASTKKEIVLKNRILFVNAFSTLCCGCTRDIIVSGWIFFSFVTAATVENFVFVFY